MNQLITNFIGLLFNITNQVIPKKKNKCVISAFPDFEDMTRGLLPLLRDKKVIVLTTVDHDTHPQWIDDNTIVCKKYTFKGIFHILTAETIYFTHGLFSFFKKLDISKQKIVNVWHGMPLKNIGLLDGKDSFPDSHELYSTSPFFQKIMAKASGKKTEDVIISGLPRNNILLAPITNEKLLNLKKQFEKVIVWLPTYRKATFGDIRSDGEELSIYGFSNFDAEKLSETLKNKNILIIIKPHPMASKSIEKKEYSNLKEIDEEWLLVNDLTLYELLSASDMLWTDFSSVFIDYLILNKPIFFVISDMDEYKNNRGFTFDITKIPLPGLVISDETELYDLLNNILVYNNIHTNNQCNFNSKKKFFLGQ